MDLFVLNLDLDEVSVIDTYKSMIWTDRYNEYGDFEIYTSMNLELLDFVKQDYYLRREDSDHVMIIESIKISSDVEEGDLITVSGRSLESILDRRIIWGQKTLSGNLQNGIQTLLNECIISPSNSARKIDNFTFKASTDTRITDLTIEAQYTGDNLYDVIANICAEQEIGFKVTLNDEKQFVFELYVGDDRSYEQLENPYVVFSPNFDNLITANYLESKSAWKNVTLVGGEGEGSERRYTAVGSVTGLDRRETFTDARDISSDVGDGETLTDEEYTSQLRQRGKETLAENNDVISFEGEAETTMMFKYGEDFFNGDVVQVADAYGHEARARITEIVTSEDTDGYSVYPTFTIVDTGNPLPDGYLELEYIQSSGTQYIDTGYKVNSTDKVEMVAEYLATPTAQVFPFGSITLSGNGQRYIVTWLPSTAKWRNGHDNNQADFPDTVSIIGKHAFIKDGGNCSIDGVEANVNEISFTSNNTLFLFCRNTGGSPKFYSSMRLYSCKIYNGNLMVRNFIPCKNESDAIGLYDTVNGVFYANAGSGAFTTA